MAIAIHNLKVAVHMVVFPVGGLEAKNARHSGESRFFKRPMERKKNEPNEQRSDRREQSEANGPISLRLGVQKVAFWVQVLWVDLKKCASCRGRKHFFKKRAKIEKRRCLEHAVQMKRTNGKSNSQVEGCGAYGCFFSWGLGGEKCTAFRRE